MLDLKIDLLRLEIESATGDAERLRPIVGRALELLAERLGDLPGRPRGAQIEALTVPPQRLDLDAVGDERAAGVLADALAEALAARLHP